MVWQVKLDARSHWPPYGVGVAWHYTLVIIPANIFIAIVNRGHKAAQNSDTFANRFPEPNAKRHKLKIWQENSLQQQVGRKSGVWEDGKKNWEK